MVVAWRLFVSSFFWKEGGLLGLESGQGVLGDYNEIINIRLSN